MAHAAWSRSVDQQDGPLRAARAGCERFVAIDDVTAVDFLDRSAKPDRLVGFTRLRLTTPRHPLFTALDDAFEPARLLFFSAHPVEQHERVDVTFPAARKREIGARDLLGHHPECEHVTGVWPKSLAAVFFRNHGREKAGAKEIVKVFRRKSCS